MYLKNRIKSAGGGRKQHILDWCWFQNSINFMVSQTFVTDHLKILHCLQSTVDPLQELCPTFHAFTNQFWSGTILIFMLPGIYNEENKQYLHPTGADTPTRNWSGSYIPTICVLSGQEQVWQPCLVFRIFTSCTKIPPALMDDVSCFLKKVMTARPLVRSG